MEELLKTIFLEIFQFQRAELSAIRDEQAAQRELLSTLITNQEALKGLMSSVNQVLNETKLKLEQNNALIAEIAGDIDELQTTQVQLVAKVAELEAKLPDEPLVAEIKALVDGQSETLSGAAAKVPEPVELPPAEPPTEPPA